jgi:hypothetical protein
MVVETRFVDVEVVFQPCHWVRQVVEGCALSRLTRFRAFRDWDVKRQDG